MGLMDLTELERLQGSTSLLLTAILFIIGIKIIMKYFRHKRKEFIGVGLSIIFMGAGQIMHAISFITYILFDFTINPFLTIYFNFTLSILLLICWIYSFSLLIFPKTRIIIFVLFLIISIIWEILLIVFLLIDPNIVGTMEGMFDVRSNTFGTFLMFFILISVTTTYGIFSYKSLKSDDHEIQWRGRFVIIAIISWIVGTILDVRIAITPLMIIIARFFMIIGAITLYLTWNLPEKIAKRIVKYGEAKIDKKTENLSDLEEFIHLLKSKPKKITEEEVTFHREKKICLVCKGKVGGFMYMCSKCNALYCGNCAQALIQLENACWVCDEAIDKSKPVKLKKEEDTDIEPLEKSNKHIKTNSLKK